MNHNLAPSHNLIIKNNQKFVDTRTEFQKLWAFITGFEAALSLNLISIILVFAAPHYFYISFIVITVVTLRCTLTKSNKTLPIKLPIELKGKYTDWNAPYPGRKAYKKALGTVMLGNIRGSSASELWQEGGDLLTHGLVIGTTGAGKTETLISLVSATTFCMGGGVFYLDPKAGNKLLIQFVILCKMFDRIDDLRVLNYKKGGATIKEDWWQKGTNSFNPFALGTSEDNYQILGALIPSDAGSNASFLASAREVMKALLPALCELRDNNIIRLNPGLIADYLNLQRMADLYFEDEKNIYVPDSEENVSFKLSKKVRRPLQMYLENLQYDSSKNASQQSDAVIRTFGYAKSYYGEPLANLAANYGHIYDVDIPEASLEDIVFNNRIFLSMLPSMENPPAEQQNLGKISLSAVKQTMALGLGPVTEGSYEDIIENLPIDLKVPFNVVADEYAEVAVPGFAVAATQGRSLGTSVTFGSQDLAGLIRADKEEAEMIFGNTLNKWLMRTQDPETTWKRFKDLASTVSVAEASSFSDAGFVNRFKKDIQATIKEVDKIHFDDVASQQEGEAHFFERGNVHKINTFYHGIDEKKYKTDFRYNRLIPIIPPSDHQLEMIRRYVRGANTLIKQHETGSIYPNISALNSDCAWLSESEGTSLFASAINKYKHVYDSNASNVGNTDVKKAKPSTKKKQKEETHDSGTKNTKVHVSGIDSEQFKASIQEQSNVKPNTPVEPTTLSKSITDTLDSENHHWLFSSDESGLNMAEKIQAQLHAINKQVYGDESTHIDEQEVAEVIKATAEETPYTSKPKVKPKDEDESMMWKCVSELLDR